MAAAIVMSIRLTADTPMVPTSRAERWKAWSLIAACCFGVATVTAGLFLSGWPYKVHLLIALSIAGMLYLPLSTASLSDDDDSPVPILDWVKVTSAIVLSAASLAAIGAHAILLKL